MRCYDARREIAYPAAGEAFFGQEHEIDVAAGVKGRGSGWNDAVDLGQIHADHGIQGGTDIELSAGHHLVLYNSRFDSSSGSNRSAGGSIPSNAR